ncbi:hypothetical protein [Paenibacillus glycanilyticus]|nr:hypothetical protein [Paenibacillus glycanilyticus]
MKTVNFAQMVIRKFISAAIATCLFTVIYAWLEPDPFSISNTYSNIVRVKEAFQTISAYMFYTTPAIYIYGIVTSLISEVISRVVTKRRWLQLTISALFHCLFGLILLRISLLAAILFFIADTVLALTRKKPYTVEMALSSTLLPICLWLVSLTFLNVTD